MQNDFMPLATLFRSRTFFVPVGKKLISFPGKRQSTTVPVSRTKNFLQASIFWSKREVIQ
jgi:hypothetical protein